MYLLMQPGHVGANAFGEDPVEEDAGKPETETGRISWNLRKRVEALREKVRREQEKAGNTGRMPSAVSRLMWNRWENKPVDHRVVEEYTEELQENTRKKRGTISTDYGLGRPGGQGVREMTGAVGFGSLRFFYGGKYMGNNIRGNVYNAWEIRCTGFPCYYSSGRTGGMCEQLAGYKGAAGETAVFSAACVFLHGRTGIPGLYPMPGAWPCWGLDISGSHLTGGGCFFPMLCWQRSG